MVLLDHVSSLALAKQFDAVRKLSPEKLIPEKERWKHTIKEVKQDGFIRYDGKTYSVMEVGKYQGFNEQFTRKTGLPWFELKLFCIDTAEILNLEWEEDDEIKASITLKSLRFSDLSDDEGNAVDEDDLDQIAQDKDVICLDGKKFNYNDDYAAKYYRGVVKKGGEKVYSYEFESSDGNCLTIEEWQSGGKEEYNIYLSRKIDANSIEVLASGG